jgi:Tfp pilus assembly protein PilF
MKDLAGAEASANTALQQKPSYPRAEYVLGRILEAKGDAAGAKLHMTKYLEIAPKAEDAAQIKAHIAAMGQPSVPEPDLDPITR